MRRFCCSIVARILAVPVTPWAWYHERRILRAGRELAAVELADARQLGVCSPERVRVLAVDRVPNPLGPLFRLLSRSTGIACFDPSGLTLRYGIFAVPPMDRDRRLLTHEFVHIVQYQQAGSLWAFLWRYIYQCLADGYVGAEWEREARAGSSRMGN